jgi:hypothetical protein
VSAVGNDATSALLRAIRRKLRGCVVNLLNFRSHSWASVTFTGARHELRIRIEGEEAQAEADRFLSNLDCAEFPMRGHLLADIALVSRENVGDAVELALEALTVEDG